MSEIAFEMTFQEQESFTITFCGEKAFDTEFENVVVVVGPIPSNYGLITWNGTILTVS